MSPLAVLESIAAHERKAHSQTLQRKQAQIVCPAGPISCAPSGSSLAMSVLGLWGSIAVFRVGTWQL